VRTVLFNYLFARHHGGDFVLRIEDTDQTRFVAGAEEYIYDCLQWCGLEPDESPLKGGPHAPYRQSERKPQYRKYAEQLVAQGNAYYAFDTPAELEEMREKFKTTTNPSPQYNHAIRGQMRNSLSLGTAETEKLLAENTPYVIRIKMPDKEDVTFTDMIRGDVHFNSSLVDDKVLLKADGMPTYHLAVVVDDYLMQISHAFRGEEWLPSAPVHILLWKYLGWENAMPQWAHLPLILKPDGNGKLSKRDGDRLGFPVFAMNWTDPKTGELTTGFRERGFLPEAFVNMLAMLGWNDGSGQELFTLAELVQQFSIARVHKGGAKFDFEKAKWFNQEWIKRLPDDILLPQVKQILAAHGVATHDDTYISKVMHLLKDRCTFLEDFYQQGVFLFQAPDTWDVDSVKPKWTTEKESFFNNWLAAFPTLNNWESPALEADFKERMTAANIKPGELLAPLRIMLVGGKFGPGVFDIAALIGKEATHARVTRAMQEFSDTPVS
jgi:glutamyl-tRNA synthetase